MRGAPIGRRVVAGWGLGPAVRWHHGESVLVVGPTRCGKTAGVVIPAILRWPGPVVVTSVKRDVLAATGPWRAALGEVQVLDPGRGDGLTWDPLEGVRDSREAHRVARALASRVGGRVDAEFWNELAAKLVALLLVRARERDRDIGEVARVLESRDFDPWLEGEGRDAMALRDFLGHDPRTLDSVLTTAETMLWPWREPQPRAVVRRTLDGPNSLYLCSPRGEQEHYQALFVGALRSVLEEQQRRADAGRSRPLLLVLDEAPAVAPLAELDELAATVAGLDVTLVTVVQDFAQMVARWGPRAATIVNNHHTRVVFAGLVDPTAATYVPELAPRARREGRPAPSWRERTPRTALVVAGHRRAVSVRARPWWRTRLARRAGPRPPR